MFNVQVFVPIIMSVLILILPSIYIFIQIIRRKEKQLQNCFVFLILSLIPLCISSIFFSNYQKDYAYSTQITEEIHSLIPKFSSDFDYYVEELTKIKNENTTESNKEYNLTLNQTSNGIDQSKLAFEFHEDDTFPTYFNRNYSLLATCKIYGYTSVYDNQNYTYNNYYILYTMIHIDSLRRTDNYNNDEVASCTIYDLSDQDIKNVIKEIPSTADIDLLQVNLELGNYEIQYQKFNTYDPATLSSNDDWCLSLLICSAIAAFLHLVNLLLSCILKSAPVKAESNNLQATQEGSPAVNEQPSTTNTKAQPEPEPVVPQRPKWEEIGEEERQKYINASIKSLYEKQLSDQATELTRQQRALKKDCLENNEFYIEDLSEEELEKVKTMAQSMYDNEETIQSNTNSEKTTEKTSEKASEKQSKTKPNNGKLIQKGFKWVLYCFTATKLGKVTSFSGEKAGYDLRYLGFGIKLLVMTLWEGYKIEKEDVLKYTIKPAAGFRERCIITLKNGKKISADLLAGASEKVTMALGAELLEE